MEKRIYLLILTAAALIGCAHTPTTNEEDTRKAVEQFIIDKHLEGGDFVLEDIDSIHAEYFDSLLSDLYFVEKEAELREAVERSKRGLIPEEECLALRKEAQAHYIAICSSWMYPATNATIKKTPKYQPYLRPCWVCTISTKQAGSNEYRIILDCDSKPMLFEYDFYEAMDDWGDLVDELQPRL